MDTSLIGLFCIVDDFCQVFLSHWKASLLEHQDNIMLPSFQTE
ncbi:hypothetical protein ACLKF5_01750 [Piscirickettsia salmonis]